MESTIDRPPGPPPLSPAMLPARTPREHTSSNVTRLLSAGAYLEKQFRRDAIRELVTHQYRVVAPSYGYDAVTVLAHALAARRLRRQQLAGVVLGVLITVVLAGQGVIGGGAVAFLLLWLLWALAFLRRVATLQALITQLAQPATGSAVGSMDDGDYPANRALTPALAEKIAREQSGYTGDRPGDRGPILYGRYDPFVGAGDKDPDWTTAEMLIEKQPHPLAAHLDRDGDDGASAGVKPVIPFTVQEITDYVGKNLASELRDDARHGERIDNLTIERRRYSRAGLAELRRRWWRWRYSLLALTSFDIEPEPFQPLGERERYGTAREFLCIRVGSWDQEVVTSVFVGFDLRGNTLYSEFYPYTLRPVNRSFHLVDVLPPRLTLQLLLRVAWDVPTGLPRVALRALATRLRRGVLWLWRLSRIGMELTEHDDRSEFRLGRYATDIVDRGAVVSLRELAVSQDFLHFFQEADTDKYIKVVQRRLLQVIRNFLTEHNVDLGDHDASEATILDNSTHNLYGGQHSYGSGANQFGKNNRS